MERFVMSVCMGLCCAGAYYFNAREMPEVALVFVYLAGHGLYMRLCCIESASGRRK